MSKITDLVVLVVMDGWGLAPAGPGNAVTNAYTPNLQKFMAAYPHTILSASGESVGLSRGEPGNTETGHLNLGAGRIVYQDLPRINLSIADGSFFKNPIFLQAIAHCRTNNSNLHLMGLIGAGGIHANNEHLFALIRLCREQKFERVFLHLFTDGRDSPPTSTAAYLAHLDNVIKREKIGTIATIMGRYWGMDRDLRWDRTEKAYRALTAGLGKKVNNPQEAIEQAYQAGQTDEFIEPSVVIDEQGVPRGKICDNDAVIFYNFRIDRPRQLTRAFVLPDFEKQQVNWDFDPYMTKYYQKHNIKIDERKVFHRGEPLANLFFATMTQYEKNLPIHVAYPPEIVDLPLGRILSEAGLRQLRAAESEKERFVGFYFNGQQEASFPGEDRLTIPSPAVATYNLKPDMSAKELTEAVINKLRENSSEYGFVLVNYANADMVGHTGDLAATMEACTAVDACVGRLTEAATDLNGVIVITADHGNAEVKLNAQTGGKSTEHTANPVPLMIVGPPFLGKPQNLASGILADVAPTILYLLGIAQPSVMTGRNLLSI
ncbi:2,3-bisphosphoglycerate-independent phosphoglycerate mutase [Candidatus Microgenomates bacterium]|nr:2,3-bisphosphoglycerate-independent phosphoglycerate mutase [Candidatus Microgenomates bacterium]